MPRPALSPLLDALPAPSPRAVAVRVTSSAESRLRRGHPWLHAEQIRSCSHRGAAGDVAVVFDRKRAFLAAGLLEPHARLRVRLLRARRPGPVDARLLDERIGAAWARRAPLHGSDTDAYRLVHGESDGMPGLVADRYADTLVVKLYGHAWIPHLRACVTSLLDRHPFARVVLRLSRRLAERPSLLHRLSDGALLAGTIPPTPLVYRERGLRFEVDPVRGQKTGAFLDQRDNRARVEALAAGRRVLDAFCCAGGFSLFAARGGARTVTSLDRAAPALAACARNVALNRHDPAVAAVRHETLHADAFEALDALARARRTFDLVVVDPPALAHRRAQVDGALAAYARLARGALGVLEPGGRIVLASCSAPVTPDEFARAVTTAARDAGRPLRGVERTGHALDHPTDFAPSRYLEALFARA